MTIERAIFEREITMIGTAKTDWTKVGPAPPKDWVPSCFMANSSNINKCAFPKRSIERLMNESCENSPFRKLEEPRQ